MLLLVYKSLNGLGPEYISDMFKEYKPSKALRSMDSGQLEEPWVKTKHGEAAPTGTNCQKTSDVPQT